MKSYTYTSTFSLSSILLSKTTVNSGAARLFLVRRILKRPEYERIDMFALWVKYLKQTDRYSLFQAFNQLGRSARNGVIKPRSIYIVTWLRGFRVKIVIFVSFSCLSIQKKTTPNIELCPLSLRVMLEY